MALSLISIKTIKVRLLDVIKIEPNMKIVSPFLFHRIGRIFSEFVAQVYLLIYCFLYMVKVTLSLLDAK